MPIDLSSVPQTIKPPSSPRNGRWVLLILSCCLLSSCAVVLLWPGDLPWESVWFWCCVLVFPLLAGLLLFALRWHAHARQLAFAHSWNDQHATHMRTLTEHGQRAIALLDYAYCTPAGSNQLAQALRNGSKPLQPVYLSGDTLRISQLPPGAGDGSEQVYVQRLQRAMAQLFKTLQHELLRSTPLCLRIKHNRVLADERVMALWQTCSGEALNIEQVHFASDEDGVLWLDAWLDQPECTGFVLSLEINLFQTPVAEQTESVSALLLAPPQMCELQKFAPAAWIHRPVPMNDSETSLADMLRWGGLEAVNEFSFIWQLQVPSDDLCAISIAMARTGNPLVVEKCLALDGVLGRPGSAVGNIALIVASEQTLSDARPQLVMLRDATAQWFVVRSGKQVGGANQ